MHPFYPTATLAAILNDVLAVVSRRDFLKPHRLLAGDARDQLKKRVEVIIH
jgi:hypothetical protein